MENKVRLKGKIQKIFPNTTGSGKRVANFTILWQNENRKYYFKCVAWEDLAREIEETGEGGTVLFDGSLRVDSWEKNGQKVYDTKVNVESILDKSSNMDYKVPDDDIPF